MLRTTTFVLAAFLAGGVVAAQDATPAPQPMPQTPTAPAPAKPAVATAPASLVESMKIVCSGKVKTSGEAGLVFTDGGEPKEVRITLQKGMSKDEVCRDVAKELAVMLGDKYSVDQYDDDKVKVEGKNGAKLSLSLGGQSATGITLELKK